MENKLVMVMEMFVLGWEVGGERGSGGGGCLLGRRDWWGSVRNGCLFFFCRMACLIG